MSNLDILKKFRVLYVEDDFETREELEMMLRSKIQDLYVAENGKEGLALYKKYRPEIVITDIQMPIMNGLSMAADIKAINPDQAIVILSAYNDTEYLFRAMQIGLQEYVTKPISVAHLLDKLVKITGQITLKAEFDRQHKLLGQYKKLIDEKAIVAKISKSGHINYVNQKFCLLSGYSEQELLGQFYLFGFDTLDEDHAVNNLPELLATQGKWQGLVKKKRKSGDTYVVDLTVVAVTNADREIEEYLALMVDMTDVYDTFERLSLNLKASLAEQQHYLSEYQNALEIGTSLCILSPEGKIISVNENFCRTLGYRPEELAGLPFSAIDQSGALFKERVLDKVKADGFTTRIFKMLGKNGAEFTLSTVIVGIHDREGGLQSLLSLNQDISDTVKLSENIIENQKELIYVMGEVVENRNCETGQHIKRVARISELLAQKYGLSADYAEMIKMASPMHDIGKIGIPDAILYKPGKLTVEEFAVMKEHATMGFDLLNKLDKPLVNMAARIAHEHHEHFDGKGYPLGLAGEGIAIESRIVALVDVFDALCSERVYKHPWSDEDIIAYLQSEKGKQFDPELVDIFIENFQSIKSIRDSLNDC
ncbi:MAG: HD domain-containing phosphohydrolase [Methylomonas sp.]|jgi:PAS domain S-box-containing protein